MKLRRTFTTEEKLIILKEAAEQGVSITLEKHSIYTSVYYKWKKKYTEQQLENQAYGLSSEHLKRIRELEKEVQSYKELVAEKELQIRMHEIIKKKWVLEKKSK